MSNRFEFIFAPRFLLSALLPLIFLGGLFALDPSHTNAAITRELPFSARLKSASSESVVPDGNYDISFRVYTVDSGGTALWSETQTVSVTNGVVSVRLGSVTPLPTSLTFNEISYYLGITVGDDAEMVPRQKISAVPMALNADTVDGAHAGSGPGDVLLIDQSGGITLQGGVSVGSSIIPTTSGINLGSSTNHFASLYVDNLNVASTDLAGTSSQAFTINSGQQTDNTDLSSVRFYLGPTLNSYAALQWNGPSNRFDLLARADSSTFADLKVASLISGSATLTLPTSSDVLVGRTTTDTLTNKTLTGPVITSPTVTGTLTASNNLTVGGALNVSGTTSIGTLTTSGDINTATITGGSLSSAAVNGLNLASGIITDPTINGTVTTSGLSIAGTLDASGNFSVATNKFTVAASSGNTAIAGTLAVTGGSGFSTLSTSGAATLYSLGVTNAATISGALTTVGATSLQGGVNVGGSATLGTNSGDALVVNSSLASNLIPSADATYDLGSATFRFRNFYAANAVFESLSTPNTTSSSFVINSANATADLEDATLEFARGTVSPNAIIRWDYAGQRFDLNQSLYVQGATTLGSSSSGSTTIRGSLTLQDSSSTAALNFGADSALYRDSANTIATTADVLFAKTLAATSGSTVKDSRAATFQGSYWNGSAATNVTGGIKLLVQSATPSYGLALQTAGSTRVYIDQSGSVGVGTTSPNGKLEVIGAATASANYGVMNVGAASTSFDGTTAGKFTGSSSGTQLAVNAATGFAGNLIDLQLAGASKFYVTSTGAVNTGPSLTLGGATGNVGILNFFSNAVNLTRTGNSGLFYTSGGTGVDGGHIFKSGADTVVLTVRGKASQTYNLQEWQDANSVVMAGVTSAGSIFGGTTANSVLTLQGNTATTGNTSTNAAIQFKVGDSAGTTAMTIRNDGNIGLGAATSPGSLLDLANTGNVSLSVRSTNAGRAVLNLGSNNQGTWSLNYDPANTRLGFFNSTNERMTITAAGSVGIGVTPSVAKLEVAGNVQVSTSDTDNSTVGVFSSVSGYVGGSEKVGLLGQLYGNSSTTTGSFTGAKGQILSSSSSSYSANTYIGLAGVVNYQATGGTVLESYGLQATVTNAGAGTINRTAGLNVKAVAKTGGGTVIYAGGIVADQQTAGTYNTNLLLGGTVFANANYSIYNSSSYNNYFAGNLGIGSALPNGKLDVVAAPAGSANYGLVNIGSATTAFDGATAGFFVGSSSGTQLAVNAATGFAGNLMDMQLAGVSKFKVAASGQLSLANDLFFTISSPQINTTGGGSIVRFMENSTERVRIGAGGKVGIGSTSPQGKLDVAGVPVASASYGVVNIGHASTQFDGSTAGTFAGSANGTLIAVNSPTAFTGNVLDLQVNGVSKVAVNNLGAVSISPTNTASTSLVVTKSGGGGYLASFQGTSTVYINSSNAEALYAARSLASSSGISDSVIVGGFVGTPQAGAGAGVKFRLNSSTTADLDVARVAGFWTDSTHATRSGALSFSTVYNGTLGEVMRVDSMGNLRVGSGSAAANGKLEVIGSADDQQLIVKAHSSQTLNIVEVQDSNGNPLMKVTASGVVEAKGLSTGIVSKTADYTLTSSDSTVTADATSGLVTLTLPTAVGSAGRQFTLKKIDASVNAVSVATTSSQTIDGATNHDLIAQWSTVTVQSDGSNWIILSKF